MLLYLTKRRLNLFSREEAPVLFPLPLPPKCKQGLISILYLVMYAGFILSCAQTSALHRVALHVAAVARQTNKIKQVVLKTCHQICMHLWAIEEIIFGQALVLSSGLIAHLLLEQLDAFLRCIVLVSFFQLKETQFMSSDTVPSFVLYFALWSNQETHF